MFKVATRHRAVFAVDDGGAVASRSTNSPPPSNRAACAAPNNRSFEIIAGERRWQAAKLAGDSEIPVVIRELSDKDAVAAALIENIQREDLTAGDEARALQRLLSEFSLTHEQVADAVGRSRAAVTNLLRLLDLPPAVLTLIDSRALGMGHARALLGLNSDAERTRRATRRQTRPLGARHRIAGS